MTTASISRPTLPAQGAHQLRRAAVQLMFAGLVAGAAAAQTPAAPMAAAGTTAAAETDVAGVWIDHTKRGAIEITPCGTRLCGYVYWVKDAVNRRGQPVLDTNNPDPARRGKPMCGTKILVNLSQIGQARHGHVWGAGSIYNPEEGANFDVELKLITPNELSVHGFLGVKLFGEQFTWTRAPADLARCGPARV